VQVHDRSPLCTVALAQYLRHPVTPLLAGEVARMIREQMYEQPVFLLCPLGLIKPTAARRINYADSAEFGAMHEQVYLEYGFDIVHVTAGTATSPAAAIADLSSEPACESWHGTGSATDEGIVHHGDHGAEAAAPPVVLRGCQRVDKRRAEVFGGIDVMSQHLHTIDMKWWRSS
jgi:hypothetical protein